MKQPLTKEELSGISPLLRTLAEIVRDRGLISKGELRIIAMGGGSTSDDVVQELELWTYILLEAKDESTSDLASRALMLRGILEEQAKVAIRIVSLAIKRKRTVVSIPYNEHPLLSLRGSFSYAKSEASGIVKVIGKGNIKKVIPYGSSLALLISALGAELYDFRLRKALWDIVCPCDNGFITTNGKELVLYKNNSVFIWNLLNGGLLQKLDFKEKIENAFYNSIDQKLVIIYEKSIDVFDPNQKTQLQHINIPSEYSLKKVGVSPDFRKLATFPSKYYSDSLSLWDLESGSLIWKIDDIKDAIFDPNWNFLGTCQHKAANLWDVETQNQIWYQNFSEHSVTFQFHPNEQILAVGSEATVILFDLVSLQKTNELTVYKNDNWEGIRITSISYDPGGTLLGLHGFYFDDHREESRPIGIILTKDLTKVMDLKSSSFVFSPDGKTVFIRQIDESVSVWDSVLKKDLYQYESTSRAIDSLCYHPKQSSILITGNGKHWTGGQNINIIDLSSGGRQRQIEEGNYIVHITPDGKYIYGSRLHWAAAKEDSYYQTYYWDYSSLRLIFSERVSRAVYDPNRSLIAFPNFTDSWQYGKEEYYVGIFDCRGSREIRKLTHPKGITFTKFSNDGKYLITVCNDENIRVWDTNTWLEIRRIKIDSSYNVSACLSPDNKTIAGNGDSVILWNFSNGEVIKKFGVYSREDLAFSPDGKLLAVSDHLIDIDTGEILDTSISGSGESEMKFCQNGKYLISQSYPGTKVWDVENRKLISSNYLEQATCIDISVDGNQVAVAYPDGLIFILTSEFLGGLA